jgi:hypothetical protein
MNKFIFITFLTVSILSSVAEPMDLESCKFKLTQTRMIAQMIGRIQPELHATTKDRLAQCLYRTTMQYKIDPKLMIAIIGTESDFVNEKISTTGDLSLAQINVKIWNREFERLGIKKISSRLLKKNEAYALNKMAIILTILKDRHEKTDRKWFARYHSQTKKFKYRYSLKIEKRLRMIASIH